MTVTASQLFEKMTTLETRLSGLEEQNQSLSSQVSSLQTERSSLQLRVGSLQRKHSDLQKQLDRSESENKVLKAQVEEHKSAQDPIEMISDCRMQILRMIANLTGQIDENDQQSLAQIESVRKKLFEMQLRQDRNHSSPSSSDFEDEDGWE